MLRQSYPGFQNHHPVDHQVRYHLSECTTHISLLLLKINSFSINFIDKNKKSNIVILSDELLKAGNQINYKPAPDSSHSAVDRLKLNTTPELPYDNPYITVKLPTNQSIATPLQCLENGRPTPIPNKEVGTLVKERKNGQAFTDLRVNTNYDNTRDMPLLDNLDVEVDNSELSVVASTPEMEDKTENLLSLPLSVSMKIAFMHDLCSLFWEISNKLKSVFNLIS